MTTNQEKTIFLETLIQPREDHIALESVRALLPPVIEHVAEIGCAGWDKEALCKLADDLRSGNMLLESSATRGPKGLHPVCQPESIQRLNELNSI